MNNKRPSISHETLQQKQKVKPKAIDARADLITPLHPTEQPMFDDSVMEVICERNNLIKAYKKVCQNKGAPGIDGITVDNFKVYLNEYWPTIKQEILEGCYQPQSVRRVDIPKPNGKGIRKLGIPTITDRFIQQAILQVLQPKWDQTFSVNSYGFRPGKSAHQAIRQAQKYVQQGYAYVVDIDLEQFFDRVNHDKLMGKLSKNIKDPRLLKLIRSYLNSGILEDGLLINFTQGVPQGGPLSPFLSNVVLDDLDVELEARGHKFCRFADDCNIYIKSERAGIRVMKSVTTFITKRLKLQVNVGKSAVGRYNKRSFLGFRLIRNPKIAVGISPDSVRKFKSKVKRITSRRWSISMEVRVKILSRYLRGWKAYFGVCETRSVLSDLDSWIRRRLRCVQWKHWKTYKNRKKNLMKLGVGQSTAHLTAWSGDRIWRMSHMPGTRIAMSKNYFKNMGLKELQPSNI